MELVDAMVLKSLKGVGDSSVTKLLEFSFSKGISTLEGLTDAGITSLPLKRVPEGLVEFLTTGDFEVARLVVGDKLKDWASQGISVISRNSEQYPSRLLELADPPPFLFCKGNLELLENSRAIAVVGTRNNTPRGKVIATKTVEAFNLREFVVVSGLALGIDTIAHRAALNCGAPTIAVLVDLLKISPSKNKSLADEILDRGGLLIAENQPGTPTIAALFAKRDRIQSGLSAAVFAVETSKGGGTMYAVKAAGKLSRPVFVPDPKAARYEDLSLEAIEGTQYLVSNKLARAYTGQSYETISEELHGVADRIKNTNLNEGQGDLGL
jgi:DNA processing protein